MLSQGTNHARRESRLGLRAPDHRKRSIASIIVTTLAAPKRTTNRKSPCPAARPQPSAASAESAASSRNPGSIQGAFISHLMRHLPATTAAMPITATASAICNADFSIVTDAATSGTRGVTGAPTTARCFEVRTRPPLIDRRRRAAGRVQRSMSNVTSDRNQARRGSRLLISTLSASE